MGHGPLSLPRFHQHLSKVLFRCGDPDRPIGLFRLRNRGYGVYSGKAIIHIACKSFLRLLRLSFVYWGLCGFRILKTFVADLFGHKNPFVMKTKLLIYSLFALLMYGMTALTSCSKDDDLQPEPEEETFDIHNPEGYFLYVKDAFSDGSGPIIWLYEFMPGQILRRHSVSTYYDYPYAVIDGNTMASEEDINFVFEGDSISSDHANFQEIVLIKSQANNQLAGKTFSGTYYKSDKSVLHQNFFYSFAADRYSVDAGFDPGTTERTESYTSIGNFAARAELDNGDKEFMVLVNNKLEVNYRVNTNSYSLWPDYHGTFTQQ